MHERIRGLCKLMFISLQCEKLEEDFIRMRGSALKLLAVMVERTDEKSDVLGYRLYREVGEALQKCLRDDDFKQKEVKNSHKAYCILLHLKDYLRLHNRGMFMFTCGVKKCAISNSELELVSH